VVASAFAAGTGGTQTSSSTTTMSADTVVVTFTVGTNAAAAAAFDLGNGHKIDFPYAAGSICDPAASSYGAGEWDRPCAASKTPVTITAKSWVNAAGLPQTDFEPAMRFVPGHKKSVLLSLKDKDLEYAAGQQVLFCTADGCVDESAADASVKTVYDSTNGFWRRPLKHFSGYSVGVGRTEDGAY
jgi:hypothetical protein